MNSTVFFLTWIPIHCFRWHQNDYTTVRPRTSQWKKNWNNWKLAKYCQLSNILLKHYWFISMLFSYYSIFTSTRYFIRKPRTVLCKHTMSTRTCSNIQQLPGRQMGEKTLRKAPTPSLGFQEVCEHHKWTDLLAVVLGQTMHNSIHFVNRRSCNLSIAKSKLKKNNYILSVTTTGQYTWYIGACDKKSL